MVITVNIPPELESRLRPFSDQVPKILELGLRELQASTQTEFEGATDILEFLAQLPKPEEVIALQPSEALQVRISQLLAKNRTHTLSHDEQQEWAQYQYLEHLVRMAKAKAFMMLKEH